MSVWRIVARREFLERARDRGFIISTAVTLGILVGIIVISAALDRGTSFGLAVVGEQSRELARDVTAQAAILDIEVQVVALADAEAAERVVNDGGADAAIVDGERILVRAEPPAQLVALIQAASIRQRSQEALFDAGLSGEQIEAVLTQRPLPLDALEPVDPRRREHAAVAFVGVLVLYGQLFAYGYWVAAGVVEEKSSRVVEVLLATVRPSQLLRGKIFGIGFLGLAQSAADRGHRDVGVDRGRATRVPFRCAGGRRPRAVLVRPRVLLLREPVRCRGFDRDASGGSPVDDDAAHDLDRGSFFIGISATSDPSSTLATVASLLPFSAPLVMPTRIVLGEASPFEVLLSIAISVATTAALIPVATKVYSRAVLQTGRVRLRNVLRHGTA